MYHSFEARAVHSKSNRKKTYKCVSKHIQLLLMTAIELPCFVKHEEEIVINNNNNNNNSEVL